MMSMRHERTRSIIGTQKFLEELRLRDDVPCDVKQSAIWCLRHYPDASIVKQMGYATMLGGQESWFGTSPDYNEDKENLRKYREKS
jgi:hypothetical protein